MNETNEIFEKFKSTTSNTIRNYVRTITNKSVTNVILKKQVSQKVAKEVTEKCIQNFMEKITKQKRKSQSFEDDAPNKKQKINENVQQFEKLDTYVFPLQNQ